MHRASSVLFVVAVLACVVFVVPPSGGREPAEAGTTNQPADSGWQDLFKGQNLDGWQNAAGEKLGEGWVVEDGDLVRKARAGDIWTKQRFGDFVLDLEFKAGGNSGIFIRTDDPKNCVQTGLEIQVNKPSPSPSTHSTGSLYDAQAP